jgi:glutathione S-transferase
MTIIDDAPEPYASLQGLHVYHAGMSNCSQRVRIAVEEKGIAWTSHVVDITTNQHLSEEYQRLHPGGVVPAVVHDGRIILNSNAIIRYIDETFEGPALLDVSPSQLAQVERLLEMSDALQASLRLLSFTHLFAERLTKTPEELEEYDRRQRNKQLVEWHRRFSSGGFTPADLDAAVQEYVADLRELDTVLSGEAWLTGPDFGVADISWMVNVRRAELIESRKPGLLELASFRNLAAWYDAVRERPSYRKGLVDWEPEVIR